MEKEYTKEINKLKKIEDDPEVWHSDRDQIIEKFISDIRSDKIKTKKEIKSIANQIYTKLIDQDKVPLWYA